MSLSIFLNKGLLEDFFGSRVDLKASSASRNVYIGLLERVGPIRDLRIHGGSGRYRRLL